MAATEMALPASPTNGSGLRWLEILESEFDGLFRELHHGLGRQPEDAEEASALWVSARSRVNGLSSVFAQMSRKSRAVFQTNCKLEAMLLAAQSELLQAKTECGELGRELRARTLQVRTLELQLRQSQATQDTTEEGSVAQELNTLRAELELEVEKYHQSPDGEERLLATILQLQQENSILHEYIQSLHTELAGRVLSCKYLQKELAGRIQQLQLIANGVRGTELEKLWQQIHTEISLQKNKSLLLAYRGSRKDSELLVHLYEERGRARQLRDKVLELSSSQGQHGGWASTEKRRVRRVTLEKESNETFGMSITGGLERESPILISDLEEGNPAHRCGQLQIGDAILSVNDTSLSRLSHLDAVSIMRAAGNTITMEVVFLIGVSESTHEEAKVEARVRERGLHRPPALEVGSTIPPIVPQTRKYSFSTSGINHTRTVGLGTTASHGSEDIGGQPVNEQLPSPKPERTPAEKLASAFALTPDTPLSSDIDIGLFWYEEVDGDRPSTPASTPQEGHRRYLVTTHEVPYSVFPSPTVARETERNEEDESLPTGTTSEGGNVSRQELVAAGQGLKYREDTAAITGDGDQPVTGPDTATQGAVTDSDTSVASASLPNQTEDGSQLSTTQVTQQSVPKSRSFHMKVAAVPIQSLPFLDTDDTPLFSI